jgi:hypothetical protein
MVFPTHLYGSESLVSKNKNVDSGLWVVANPEGGASCCFETFAGSHKHYTA